MQRHDTIIIGAGQAGLALSRCLTNAGIDHVLLERGRVAERWRSERWDSLRMLTPNWMTRLPGLDGDHPDPDGFMTKDALISMLEDYASSFRAPVREETEVTRVRFAATGFAVSTTAGEMTARNVVIATGQCGQPFVPEVAAGLDSSMEQLHAAHYRRPDLLPDGGVLVVGAGASGLQISAELRAAGRSVVIASGRHARALRRYRGRDIWWWLERTGSLDQTVDEVADIEAARRSPSLGLTGADGGTDIDLGSLDRAGVQVAGRLIDAEGHRVRFDATITHEIAEAEIRLRRLLDRFDDWASAKHLDVLLDPPTRPVPVRVEQPVIGDLDLAEAGVGSIVWSTGYRTSYPWLEVPVLDATGEIVQRRGATDVAGLYVLGLRFQWRRGSHFVDGVGRDAEYLSELIEHRARRYEVA
jgi:putative flavoprotein involved in K+ transport